MPRARLSRFDREAIIRRAMGHCECDRANHDHGMLGCHRPVGPRSKFVFEEGSPHNFPSQLNVIIVCPTCYSYIQLEKGIVSG
jgi:hypothetical protein